MRLRRIFLVLGVLALALSAAALARKRAVRAARLTPERLSATLRPADVVHKPEGPGPFPLALVLHGCTGVGPWTDDWARWLAGEGFAAVVVDSLGPRGLASFEASERVCAGRALTGDERAGDVLVTLADARAMPFVDPSRMVIVGFSHGAWAAMDLLAMDPPARTPTGLTHVPSGLDGLAAVVLFYPFCGPGSLAREGGWRHAAPALMLLAGADAVVSTPDCLAAADRVRQGGRPIDVHVYPATPHAFDQRSPRDRADARARVSAFLRRAVGPAPR